MSTCTSCDGDGCTDCEGTGDDRGVDIYAEDEDFYEDDYYDDDTDDD
ncbi:hypothetical protein [Pleionea mediterranea]|uniref:Uncharacterized protein n=1 Tax=Pleionea mediterranea TaxID=523701 RepID=A0A316FTH8_9GAMM|nr:hypothetical protein [Pleionea mediterranea]PWK51879.1 hypothetical protein C8D97_105195 [Pleionea mediterranea]